MTEGASSSNASTTVAPNDTSNGEAKKNGGLAKHLSPEMSSYFIAGGVAGAASRTVVSPLERLKIIMQVQPKSTVASQQYKGVWPSLVRMWKEEGFAGFMRGNGVNCIRIVPYSAVQFTTYEHLKRFFSGDGARQLDTPTRLLSGALAGITSVSATYPLDLVRARLSIAHASLPFQQKVASIPSTVKTSPTRLSLASYSTLTHAPPIAAAEKVPGMWGMTLKVVREEGGIRGLYRGMVPTAVGVAPYVGINFAAYEFFRGILTPPSQKDHPVYKKLACGALAGSISQTLTYPFDVLRRRQQVMGMASNSLGYKQMGAIDTLISIVKTEGVRGLYKGLWPNLLKVAPSIATSFFTYETVKEFLTS
jgi:solute carrier family 25 phosphate transporter 23/24/25/41